MGDGGIERALREGRAAGRDRACQAQDSPYQHDDMPRRTAWMRGFGETRGEAPVPSDRPPGRGLPPLHEA